MIRLGLTKLVVNLIPQLHVSVKEFSHTAHRRHTRMEYSQCVMFHFFLSVSAELGIQYRL